MKTENQNPRILDGKVFDRNKKFLYTLLVSMVSLDLALRLAGL